MLLGRRNGLPSGGDTYSERISLSRLRLRGLVLEYRNLGLIAPSVYASGSNHPTGPILAREAGPVCDESTQFLRSDRPHSHADIFVQPLRYRRTPAPVCSRRSVFRPVAVVPGRVRLCSRFPTYPERA